MSEIWLEITVPAPTSVYLGKATGRKQAVFPGGRHTNAHSYISAKSMASVWFGVFCFIAFGTQFHVALAGQ